MLQLCSHTSKTLITLNDIIFEKYHATYHRTHIVFWANWIFKFAIDWCWMSLQFSGCWTKKFLWIFPWIKESTEESNFGRILIFRRNLLIFKCGHCRNMILQIVVRVSLNLKKKGRIERQLNKIYVRLFLVSTPYLKYGDRLYKGHFMVWQAQT